MSISQHLRTKSSTIAGKQQFAYAAVADALEVIPRTLAANCGVKPIRTLTQLRAKHAQDPVANKVWGIDGLTGQIADVQAMNIWEPLVVKSQTIKTAIEAAIMLLRVDKIMSGTQKPAGPAMGGAPPMM